MNDIERIYSLLSHSNGLKIRAISKELELDRYYVAEIMFSADNIPYWYQDDDSLWFAKEGSLQVEEPHKEKDDLITSVEIPQKFNLNRFLDETSSDSLRSYLYQISKYRVYSNDETIELFKRYRNGDAKAFDMIIKSQQRLVANIALLYCRKGASLEDIIQEGNIGLVKAAERFDYTQFRSFSNYAKSWILQSITFSMATIPYMVRLPLNQLFLYNKVRRFKDKFEQTHGYNPSVNDIEIGEEIDAERIKYLDGLPYNLNSLTRLYSDLDFMESGTNAIEDFIDNNDSCLTVNRLLKFLGKRQKQIIMKFYGINTKEETLSTIGDSFGLTRERVRQIKEKTLKALRYIYVNQKGIVRDKEFMAHDDDDLRNQSEKQQIKSKKKPTGTHHGAQEMDGLKVGDEIYFDKKSCVIKRITKKGKVTKLSIEYANGFLDVVSYSRSRCKKKHHQSKSSQNNHLKEIEQTGSFMIKEAMVGDTIVYDGKRCVVIEKKTMSGSLRLVVKYGIDGTFDNLHNDCKRYKIVSSHKKDGPKKTNRSKIENNELSNIQLSTSLNDLFQMNLLTSKQLYQCNKKGLRTIGDVQQIIERYHLTPDSTRFTKYTLDMWFGIMSLINKLLLSAKL